MMSEEMVPIVHAALEPLQRYHRYQVEGMEHIPPSGPALLVFHHSLATYDALLLGLAIYEATGRLTAALGHDRLFDLPGVRHLTKRLGIRRASPENGRMLLTEGHLVGVAPGGMYEALRPSTERYQHRWADRKGFARLALETQVPIIVAACPRADELFDVRAHPLTDWVYARYKLPLPFAKGRRGLPVPRRVPLVHHIAPPLQPPKLDPSFFDEQVDALHADAMTVMERLLARRD